MPLQIKIIKISIQDWMLSTEAKRLIAEAEADGRNANMLAVAALNELAAGDQVRRRFEEQMLNVQEAALRLRRSEIKAAIDAGELTHERQREEEEALARDERGFVAGLREYQKNCEAADPDRE